MANHLTSENDMRSRYKRKKAEIEAEYNRLVVELQKQKLSKEGKIKHYEFLWLIMFYLEYKRELDRKTAEFNQKIKALDEEIRNVQILFIQAYKK